MECNLIKKYKPKFNIRLKDNKTFPYVQITNEKFPRVIKIRKPDRKLGEFFGPFVQANRLSDILNIITKFYPIRHCRQMRTRQHPCLYFHLGRCSAPCCERISEQVYREIIWEIRKILKGHYKELKKNLQEEMDSYSKVLEFEKAAKIRDKLIAIEYLDNKQKIINNNNASEDYIAFDNFKSSYSFSIIKIREGKLIDKENYFIKSIENNQNTLMNFIKTYYTEKSAPPAILYISNRSSECDLIANALSNREKRRIRIILPQKGEKKKLIELTRQNAQFYLERKNAQFAAHSQLISLQKSLELKILPKRIEGFDIATIEGKYSYGSMVSFYNARADKVNYRIFKPAESGSVND